ncbi:MAG TPA: HEAT repeat domain-containing protein, partial [Methanoculleus sp.]|nr:HEAT repeat domain-containing protein [Methanoculleus sp.]
MDLPVPEEEETGEKSVERAFNRHISMLRWGGLNERWRAADALAEFADDRAVQPLIEALDDNYADVRWRAATALGILDGR